MGLISCIDIIRFMLIDWLNFEEEEPKFKTFSEKAFDFYFTSISVCVHGCEICKVALTVLPLNTSGKPMLNDQMKVHHLDFTYGTKPW